MAIFHLTAIDNVNSFELRLETRPKHIEFLESLGDDLLMAGPIINDEQKPSGTIAIFIAENHAAASQIMAQDPYAKVNLFASSEIKEIKPLFGDWTKNL